jgi:hypothetical protein
VTLSPSIAARRETRLQDLCGLAAKVAIGQLRALELRPAIEPHDTADPDAHGRVVAHDPAAGEPVRRGQLVTLLIGHTPCPPAPPGPVADGPGTQGERTPAQAPPSQPDRFPADQLPVPERVETPVGASSDHGVELSDDDTSLNNADDPDMQGPPVAGSMLATAARRGPLRGVGVGAGAALIAMLAVAAVLLPGRGVPARARRAAVAAGAAVVSAPALSAPGDRPVRRPPVRRPRPAPVSSQPALRRVLHPVVATSRPSVAPAPSAPAASDPSSGPATSVDPPAPVVGVAPPSPTGPLPGPYPIQSSPGGSK